MPVLALAQDSRRSSRSADPPGLWEADLPEAVDGAVRAGDPKAGAAPGPHEKTIAGLKAPRRL